MVLPFGAPSMARGTFGSQLLRISLAAVTFAAVPFAAVAFATLHARPAGADWVRTKDGLVIEGPVAKEADGSVTVTTEKGTVRLAASRVDQVQTGEGPRAALRRELDATDHKDADALYRVGLLAESKGQPDLAKEALVAVIALQPDHAAARRALGYEKVDGSWITVPEARRRRGLVLYAGAWVLPVEAEAAAKAEAAASPAAFTPADEHLPDVMRTAAHGEEALARAAALKLARTDAKERLPVALALLGDPDPKVRAWACIHLASIGDQSALKPLVFSAVRDRDPDVRREATVAAASFGHEDVAMPFLRALGSTHEGIAVNAARALEVLGDTRAVATIVKRISGHGGSPRVVMETLTKTAYVRDYDVEIAQAANIANPVVGVVQDGMVFDVHVLDAAIQRTVLETVLVNTFNSLTGANVKDAQGVLAWWSEKGKSRPEYQPKR